MTELGVTVTVAALLTALAVPSFQGIVATHRARTYASALYATLSKARSEAITLNANATVQPKGGWSTGWQIVVNNNVLDDYTAASNINEPGFAGTVIYTPSGRLLAGSAPPMFQINTMSGSQTNYQCVSINPSGRPYMTTTHTC